MFDNKVNRGDEKNPRDQDLNPHGEARVTGPSERSREDNEERVEQW